MLVRSQFLDQRLVHVPQLPSLIGWNVTFNQLHFRRSASETRIWQKFCLLKIFYRSMFDNWKVMDTWIYTYAVYFNLQYRSILNMYSLWNWTWNPHDNKMTLTNISSCTKACCGGGWNRGKQPHSACFVFEVSNLSVSILTHNYFQILNFVISLSCSMFVLVQK